MTYDWFTSLSRSDELEQWDIIPECPIIKPPENIAIGPTSLQVELVDCVVLSQSCDLLNGKIEIVLVAPYYSLEDFLSLLPPEQQNSKGRKKSVEELRKWNTHGYHLLNKDNVLVQQYYVVDFRNIYGIHISSLKSVAEKLDIRTRLLPPYREHLSQAFARYFMRVGLPQDFHVEWY